ncbi:type IV secretory system conjugative DNA transfer family protein [Nocardia brasiliensis]|uniref:type IV secretory system conjugative DNA transfer family protein n=1 Tax=Nocardia brasiliensis TaxID=37326 RepID=UPI00189301D2|nr:type IV secretory system conjugative DNA transfer family protein [Nocardia brasiliensis]MBF6546953.1 type IV secretory system conjugative DNA transfer family protein [Nocardia brasiliensis]
MTATLIFSQLYLPRPLSAVAITQPFNRLAADPSAPPIVLETRADTEGTRHLLGVAPEHLVWIHRTLCDLLPGLIILPIAADRPRIDAAVAATITLSPAPLGLLDATAESATAALLSALHARLLQGEELVVQVILGSSSAGRTVRGHAPDPGLPLWRTLSRGHEPAPSAVARQIEQRLALNGFRTAIRVGITASSRQRAKRLGSGLIGALSTAKPPGTKVTAARSLARQFNQARPPGRWPLRLTPPELPCVLGWPIGDGDLPGVAPIHPKLLMPRRIPRETERIIGHTALPGTGIPIGISPPDSLMHQVLLGPTGSGKSTVLQWQIHADAVAGRPMLVIDPKKQLIDDIVANCIPVERIDQVVITDPADPQVPGFNPLDVGDRDPDVVVDGLLAVFKAVFSDGWGPRTEDIFLATLLTLARAGKRRGTPYTLLDLPTLLTDDRFRRSVIGAVTDDAVLEGFWANYNQLASTAQAAMIAAPMNKLRRYLLRPSVTRMLGQPRPRFRLRDIFRDNKIVLVALNDGLIGPITAQLLGSLFVSETWMATLERANEHRPMDRPGIVVVDECQNYVHLPTSFGDALSQSRSYGVAWVLAHQSRKQMPPELLESVDSNARSKVIFRLESAKDAADVAKLAPELDAADIQKLPVHHAYARVVTGGESSGWTAIKTLAPPEPTGLEPLIRQRSRVLYGDATPARSGGQSPDQAPAPAAPVGRRRRADRSGDTGRHG